MCEEGEGWTIDEGYKKWEEEECEKRRHGAKTGVLTQQGHIAMAWRTKEGLHKVVHPGLVHTANLTFFSISPP